ncbi:MAG: DinB family protein [Chloroflexia bacterium]
MDTTAGRQDSMIVDLFRHNAWANLRLLEACEGLTSEQLNATVPGTYGTIRDTLLHIVGSEVSYVHRVNGHMPGDPPKPGEFPGFDVLKRSALWCGEELPAMALQAATTDIVQQTPPRMKLRYPLTGLLTQAINHSTEHRAQVATILTQQGIEPPDMSGWEYMEATGTLEEPPV